MESRIILLINMEIIAMENDKFALNATDKFFFSGNKSIVLLQKFLS